MTSEADAARGSREAGPEEGRRVFAIVLAAGRATRFGSAKQLAAFDGAPLVVRAVRLAESVCGTHSVLVAGHEWQPVVAACAPLQGFFVNNSEHAEGMGSSIASGTRSIMHVADAVLLLLCDQPLVRRDHLERLLAVSRQDPGRIVASAYAGTAGPPILFPRRWFGDLAALQGDRGAREILEQAPDDVRVVTVEEAAIDIDRPEDLRELQ